MDRPAMPGGREAAGWAAFLLLVSLLQRLVRREVLLPEEVAMMADEALFAAEQLLGRFEEGAPVRELLESVRRDFQAAAQNPPTPQ